MISPTGCGAAECGLCKSEIPEPLRSRCLAEKQLYGEGFYCPRGLFKEAKKKLEEIRAKEIMNATAEDADERRGEIMRMGDLFIKYPVLKKKFDEYIKLVNPEENTVFCGAFYPADECINCREKDAKSTRNCLFKEELKEE